MMFRMPYWLIKQEPSDYSWDDLVKDKKTTWNGVRNFQARNNLRAMKKGDLALFYHSGDDKGVVGIATIIKEAYPDATADEGDWVAVDVAPLKAFMRAVSLAEIKEDSILEKMAFARQSRLSVSPVTESEWNKILTLGQTKL